MDTTTVAVYKVKINKIVPKKGLIAVHLTEVTLICCYLPPNKTMEDFEIHIRRIVKYANKTKENFIILGDFNAKAPEWGSPITDQRGTLIMEHVTAKDLIV